MTAGARDAELAVLTGNGTSASASIESNSWGLADGETYPVIYAKTAHAIDLRAAAEGVGIYFASGDNPGISVPASDPYSLAVGGTTLGIGASNTTVFETGWSNDAGFRNKGKWIDEGIHRDASGGGASLLYAQQGQPSNFGFINPLIYQLAGTRTFRDVLPVTAATPKQDRAGFVPGGRHFGPSIDVLDSQLPGYTSQVTAKGYDTMTGVGTPNGAAFLVGLRRAAR